MFRYQKSIRQKITFGYYVIVAMIVGISVFTFIELRYLEKKIAVGEIISEFFNTALEIRRFEKNYFLYRQESDYLENIGYVRKAREVLEGNVSGFNLLAEPIKVAKLRQDLDRYLELMTWYGRLAGMQAKRGGAETAVLEGRIRETGKDITTFAEDISKNERQYMQRLLKNSRNLLIFLIIALSFMVIIIGQMLSRIIVRPLKLLERSMEIIAGGNFENIHIDSKDREIVSLTGAFNKMLRELELRQRHLIQSEKLASLGTLLSGVAHELNNPLSNISSSCQILLEEIAEGDTEYKRELLDQIEGQTDRARNIVRSLLEFSRDKEFKKETLNLDRLFEETIRFIKGQVPAKVGIKTDIPVDIVVFADKQRLQQAFLNLIKNALESMEEEGRLTIDAHCHRAIDKVKEDEMEIYNYLKYSGKCTIEEDTVDIKITDTGSGIPEDLLPKVFDPFFTTKDVGKGSGLGLFIVHEIIEEHDGCIAVDSKIGKGTTFLIRLPMKKTG